MTIRTPFIATDAIYHTYNKSIAKTIIFDKNILEKTFEIINFYRYQQKLRLSKFNTLTYAAKEVYLKDICASLPLIDFFAFSLMPNHFHFLIKQLQTGGIKKFISNFQNSFAKRFNLINNREGSLFLNGFKCRQIISENEFFHVFRYIHLNPVSSRLIAFPLLASYPFNSYGWYLNENLNRFINVELAMGHFESKEKFVRFHKVQVDYQQKLQDIKKALIDA